MTLVLRHALLAAAVAAGTFACSSAPNESTQGSSESISGGYVDTDHPGVMALVLNYPSSSKICSATLIAIRNQVGYVLTASHCFNDSPTPGDYTLVQASAIGDPNQTLYPVKNFVRLTPDPISPNVTNGVPTNENDFAIAMFDATFTGPSLQAITISPLTPELDQNVLFAGANGGLGTPVTIVGYGAPVLGVRQYANNYLTWVDTTTFGYSESSYGGACSGDSGGPVLVTLSDGHTYVAGVNSTAVCTSYPYSHGEAGRVSAVYKSFIAQYVPPPDPPSCTTPRPISRCTLPGGWRCCGGDQGWVCGVCD
jgi:hypothetical protein